PFTSLPTGFRRFRALPFRIHSGSGTRVMGRSSPCELSPEQRALIEKKIAEYIVGTSIEEARRAAAGAHALPLDFGWTACLALRPDGQVVCIDYDEPEQARVVEDERERIIGLFRGGRNDPDLRWLIPERPFGAIDCPDCRGTGKLTFPA